MRRSLRCMRSSVVLLALPSHPPRQCRGRRWCAVRVGQVCLFVCLFFRLYVGWPVDFAERRQYSDKDMLPFIYKGIRSLIR